MQNPAKSQKGSQAVSLQGRLALSQLFVGINHSQGLQTVSSQAVLVPWQVAMGWTMQVMGLNLGGVQGGWVVGCFPDIG